MKHLFSLLALTISFTGVVLAMDDKFDVKGGQVVQEFTRPALYEENFGAKIFCVRPVFDGSPDLEFQRIETSPSHFQHIITTSGLGGSGITLGEGIVDHQINRFIRDVLPDLSRGKETEICVLGSGWVGAHTTLKLNALGFRNLQMITDVFAPNKKNKSTEETTTTENAGGLIAPVSMKNDSEAQKLADECGIKAYKSFLAAMEGSHPFMDSQNNAVMKVPAYFDSREESGLEPYVSAGIMRPAIDVKLEIKDTEKSYNMICYEDGMFANPRVLLGQLHNHIAHTYQIPVKTQRVTSFSSLPYSVIFNCTGIGAADFNERASVRNKYVPTLGHLIMLQGQDFSTNTLGVHNSMILRYGAQSITEHGHNCTDSLYAFPKQYEGYDAVAGGTFIQGVSLDENRHVIASHSYPEKFKSIITNLHEFFGYNAN